VPAVQVLPFAADFPGNGPWIAKDFIIFTRNFIKIPRLSRQSADAATFPNLTCKPRTTQG
jgi:hypothetical protein